jgi:peptidoglycan/xylan/chitin deacetylase (PgdA/CDA1 family)
MKSKVWILTAASAGILAAAAVLLQSCAGPGLKTASGPRMFSPPSGLTTAETPQFVYFTTDDNRLSGLPESGRAGGLHFLTELFAARRNPPGSGNPGTFDGSELHYTFFVNTMFLSDRSDSARRSGPGESPVHTKRAWKEALDRGHEIAVHTHSHPHGREFSVAQWRDEIRQCLEVLARPWDPGETVEHPNPGSGLGVARADMHGFRAPYAEYNDNALTAAELEGLTYDSSIEELDLTGPGGEVLWPGPLVRGLPLKVSPLGPHPALLEVPISDYTVPPDGECERYGVPSGLRDRLNKVRSYFDPGNGAITGMDWNLWQEFFLTPSEFLAVLKYTLDKHLSGNRNPMIVGLHCDLYSDRRSAEDTRAPAVERRAVLQAFLDYALQKPDVRVVSIRELLGWQKRPVPLR